jgi:hypothetical protein
MAAFFNVPTVIHPGEYHEEDSSEEDDPRNQQAF